MQDIEWTYINRASKRLNVHRKVDLPSGMEVVGRAVVFDGIERASALSVVALTT